MMLPWIKQYPVMFLSLYTDCCVGSVQQADYPNIYQVIQMVKSNSIKKIKP